MRCIFDQTGIVTRFVAQMVPHARIGNNTRAIGVVDNDDELIAGMVYNYAMPNTGVMEITVAALPGHRWMTRETIRAMFEYPFFQCGCQMLITITRASDRRALRQLAAMGCALMLFPRLFGRDQDGVVARLTKEDWEASKFYRRKAQTAEIDMSAMGEAA